MSGITVINNPEIRHAVMNELPARVGIRNVGGTRVVTEIQIGAVND